MPALPWLACLLCLALAWFGLGLSCLPCLGLVQQQQQRRRSRRRPPPAAEGGRLLLLDKAKARQARQAQARPSQGKAQQASQPSQSRTLGPKGPLWSLFGDGFFENWSETGRRGSVWRDIGTILILPGLGSLWDGPQAPRQPKTLRLPGQTLRLPGQILRLLGQILRLPGQILRLPARR